MRLFGVAILQLLLLGATGQEIPELPDYFSGYVESQTMLLESGKFAFILAKVCPINWGWIVGMSEIPVEKQT